MSITEAETRQAIRSAYEQQHLLLEPHGALGWAGLQKYLAQEEQSPDPLCISLESAHPAKFPEEIRAILGFDPPLPPSLQGIEDKEEESVAMANDYAKFQELYGLRGAVRRAHPHPRRGAIPDPPPRRKARWHIRVQ